ncbi:MAG: methylated-DNA--[protein]-cysteine S-methyltransferase [Chitinophagales bacterium]|nr:methylated-DNA--[protein]-cysteine S-methyltransferase [Chitinophagales bacterium]
MLYRTEWKSPLGELILMATEDKLCLCDWKYRNMRASIDKRILDYYKTELREESNEIINETIHQLNDYFEKKRTEFDIPLELIGTKFQQRVWQELQRIPYGKTISYLQLSKNLGDEKTIRAAATANGANCISILIPCHRVIGSDGALTGYAGGLPAKKKLLIIEGSGQKELF